MSDGGGGTWNARLTLKGQDGMWTAAAFANNIANSRIVVTDVITFSYPEVSLNEPRVFGVALERKF